jgi:16S rRNA (guanine1516-N2)-methyltransferase
MPASLAKAEPVVIETLGPTAQGFSFALEKFEDRVQLRALHRPDYGPICADWLSKEMQSRIAGGRKQLLARAVGMRKTSDLTILDGTAGLGRDGFTLAALGAKVVMTERNPQIFALLENARARASADSRYAEAAARIALVNQDALTVLARQPWDAVYLDPMYTHMGKTALPQKEMQIFRDLTDGDPDADRLLLDALKGSSKRVVVKRAAKAEWLAGIKPGLSLGGSQARFDIYLPAP